jgi:ABC-type Zn uptake system ZnuABC Zn-binding protein ZnuA
VFALVRTILSLFSVLLLLGGVLSACGGGGEDEAAVTVTATTTQAADLARNVAGERAEVVGLLTAGSDPHDYEPRPSDAEALIDSDLIVRSGGDVDGWLDQLIESSGSEAPELVLLDRVETIDAGGEPDPHWWQDPVNAIRAVEAIRDELIAVDPDGRREYERNAAAYVADLRRLDREVAACIDGLPAADRKLVTSHDSLAYFADRYGIEVVGTAIPALTTQAQASAGETAELVDLIRAEEVPAVFPEAGVNPDLEEAIATEADAVVGGELWADALGPEGSDAETYTGALAVNAATIPSGLSRGELGCQFG